MIGDDIEVTIVDIAGGRVRFGINAPSGVAVVRGKDPAKQIVMVGADVSVEVVDIRGDKVRLGVVSPRHMSVHRKEIWEAIRRENSAAARETPVAPAAEPRRNPAKALHDDIAGALVMKFSDAAEPLIDEIRQMSDLDTLKRIAVAVESATTLADVRRVWSK
jgi:carbon storage regulator